MKCTLCDEQADQNRWNARQLGWRFIEYHGSFGSKYGVFCPKESKRDITQAVAKFLELEAKK